MSTPTEQLHVLKVILIVTYAVTVPTMAQYITMLVRMLKSKDRHDLMKLIIVCLFMIVS